MVLFSDYSALQANHPTFKHIRSVLEDGQIRDEAKANKWNTCCIQMSIAMNKSQMPIENYDYFDPWLTPDKDPAKSNRVRALPDNKGNNYIYSVLDMKVYLNKKYFQAENYQRPYKKNIMGRKGIIAFGVSHMDLWDGKEFHQEQIFGGWSAWDASDGAGGIFFWEVLSLNTLLEDALKS
ncbi:T6SS effector amidase Tae4 family protein [Dyadobacter arcticus]|uniref:Uncharacterized protein n=1 Tax=Dyadobacter arcticus TaxID=1078754 RepID=A0ABX0UDS9_9BACT|nr:T6SS effector amidase Tae4 family protein [Dyadobacter arcticus]NIJ51146.1 hypothetical protein [Dyadobacter arcticus]